MWLSLFVDSRPCSQGFSPDSLVLFPSTNTNISKFQFDQDKGPRMKTSYKADVTYSVNILGKPVPVQTPFAIGSKERCSSYP